MLTRLIPGTPPWGAEDSAALRAFFLTTSGQRFLLNLLSMRPVVSGKEREARLIQSDERAGYEAAIADAMLLAEPKPISHDDLEAQRASSEQTITAPASGA